jgi:hypothetical protein
MQHHTAIHRRQFLTTLTAATAAATATAAGLPRLAAAPAAPDGAAAPPIVSRPKADSLPNRVPGEARRLTSKIENTTSLLAGTPAVYAPTPTGFTITLPVRRAAAAWIDYGETETLDHRAACDPFGFAPQDDIAIKIRLTNLKPGTRYHWRATLRPLGTPAPAVPTPGAPVSDGAAAPTIVSRPKADSLPNRVPSEARSLTSKIENTPTYTAKTLDPAAPSTRFTIWNDTHDQAPTIQKLHSLRNPADDFRLWNGDLSNNVNDPALLPGLYVSPKNVDLAEGPPILLTQGNHDHRGLHARAMHRYVDYPGSRSYYALRTGPVALIALDTGEDKPDAHPSFKGVPASEPHLAEQARWLADIITHPGIRDAPYRLIACHIPLRWTNETPQDYAAKGFDRVSLRGRAHWHDTLVKWGAQLIISGHVHRAGYLPPTPRHPYAQLLGGGPGRSATDHPTLIRAHADARRLRVTCTRIDDNTTAHDLTFPPLA